MKTSKSSVERRWTATQGVAEFLDLERVKAGRSFVVAGVLFRAKDAFGIGADSVAEYEGTGQ
jgi:hypothetical protein